MYRYICILTQHRLYTLKECLKSIGTPPDCEIIVSIQGDQPETASYLKRQRVSIIQNERDLGVAGGRADQIMYLLHNGLEEDDIVVFLDDDIIAKDPDWIGVLTQPIMAGEADIVGAQGGYVTHKFYTLPSPEGDCYPDYVGGGWCAVSGKVFHAGVIHDTRFNPYGWEDVDFCYQAREKGFRIMSISNTGLYHPKHMGDIGLFNRSRALFMQKWSYDGRRK